MRRPRSPVSPYSAPHVDTILSRFHYLSCAALGARALLHRLPPDPLLSRSPRPALDAAPRVARPSGLCYSSLLGMRSYRTRAPRSPFDPARSSVCVCVPRTYRPRRQRCQHGGAHGARARCLLASRMQLLVTPSQVEQNFRAKNFQKDFFRIPRVKYCVYYSLLLGF